MIRFLQKQHRFRPFFLFFLAFILIISCSFPSLNAQEESKPKAEDLQLNPFLQTESKLKAEDWQLNGILAALDDPYPEVRGVALEKVSEYNWQNESSKKLKPTFRTSS